MNDEKIIRKLYGENMWNMCKKIFPTILVYPGYLAKIFQENFNPSRFLYEDIIKNNAIYDFQKYIYSLTYMDINKIKTTKTVRELLEEKGYILYECHTEEDIQNFKHFYKKGETICTITNGNRLDRNFVFFAVKKNVDSIIRSDCPRREDDYGTSVISIQFTRGDINIPMITNRYNHTVPNSDATFDNNLENINQGLTDAFEREYELKIYSDEKQDFIIPNYIKANDGKFYKYNYKIDNVYFCPDNTIIDQGEVITDYQEKEKYLIIDCYILDLQNHKLLTYKDIGKYDDFTALNASQYPECEGFDNELGISQIIVENIDEGKKIEILLRNGCKSIIHVDKHNKIIYFENNNFINKVSDLFSYSDSIERLILTNVRSIGSKFMDNNKSLKYIKLENTEIIEDRVLEENIELKVFIAPHVTNIGDECLSDNQALEYIDIASVKRIGDSFLFSNNSLKKIELPNLEEAVDSVLKSNQYIDISDYISNENIDSHWNYLY